MAKKKREPGDCIQSARSSRLVAPHTGHGEGTYRSRYLPNKPRRGPGIAHRVPNSDPARSHFPTQVVFNASGAARKTRCLAVGLDGRCQATTEYVARAMGFQAGETDF